MEPVTLALATALVGAMVTDGWQQARSAAVDLWRRGRDDGEAAAVAVRLTDTRARVLDARDRRDADAEHTVVTDWAARLQWLAAHDPALLDELRALLLPPDTTDPAAAGTPLAMEARATGRARVYQAGRDINVTER